jgi:hypothetical protein
MPLVARVLQIAALVLVQSLEARRTAVEKATRRSGSFQSERGGGFRSKMLEEDDEDLSEDDEELSGEDGSESVDEERVTDDTGRARLVPADEVNVLNFSLSDMLDGDSCGSDEDSDVLSEADDESRDPLSLAEADAKRVLAYVREMKAHFGEEQFASLVELSSASSVCDRAHSKAIQTLVEHARS